MVCPAEYRGKTSERVRRQYEVEKELANRLRNASREERSGLYSLVYAELFQRLPDHPAIEETPDTIRRRVLGQMLFLGRFLNKDAVLLEIGPGRCELSFEAAKYVKKVYALDVDEKVTDALPRPRNFELVLYGGVDFPMSEASVDVAYSNQFIEHLHAEDALEHLANIHSALVPGGVYICATPNRLSGPHDVSMYFDRVATCLHLKEYTTTELAGLFKRVGFSRVSTYAALKNRYCKTPLFAVTACEAILGVLPYRLKKALAGRLPLRAILGVRLVGVK